jgi:hypothetical protein
MTGVGKPGMNARDDDRMSGLERHCRLLLHVYPAAYRSERGDEIIGTLLETTPAGRAWPVPRDIRGLITGGLRARATLNRRATTAANLRLAVLVGLVAYFASAVATTLTALASAAERGVLDLSGPYTFPFGWRMLLPLPLIAVTLVLAWMGCRRAIVLAGALPAAAAVVIAGSWRFGGFGFAVTELSCLAALVALTGAKRPDRRWLWLIGLIVFDQLLRGTGEYSLAIPGTWLLLSLALVSIAWLAIDARPAIAMLVVLLAMLLPLTADDLATGMIWSVLLLLIPGTVIAVAVWRLRRQSAHPGRPTRA